MIDAATLRNRMGVKKFTEFAVNNRPKGERMLDRERRRSRGTNVKYRKCEHGVWIIDNYERKHCDGCEKRGRNYSVDSFQPHFNQGLGCYVESKSDFKRALKANNATHIGDDRL